VCSDAFGALRTVAGVDVGFDRQGSCCRAAVVVLQLPALALEEQVVVERPVQFPYVPGLLGFREAPVALAALAALTTPPDLLVCDGQGLAHPRRFGLACHLGLLADIPSIGAAKSRLIGSHAPVGDERGDWQPLLDAGEVIGAVLRTRPCAHPLYVSSGHRISLASAIDLVLRCSAGYRLPEPTRRAHQLAAESCQRITGVRRR
jgi:deoxyribonuclease V